MVSLRALECLVAVADSGSVTRAAQLLHMSQPAVSQQLTAFERETRTPLVHRGARGVTLTPAGRSAVVEARRAIEAADGAVRLARATAAASGGSLRIAGVQSLTVPLLAPVMRLWARTHPGVTVTLQETAALDVVRRWVDNAEVDLAVFSIPPPMGYDYTVVGCEEIVLTSSADHRLARENAVRLDDLDKIDLVHFAAENGLSSWLDESLSAAGVHPRPVVRTAVTMIAPALAASGMGVAITPVSAVSAGFRGAVRSFDPPWFRELLAVTPTAPDPLTTLFIDDLRQLGVPVPDDVRAQLVRASRDRGR